MKVSHSASFISSKNLIIIFASVKPPVADAGPDVTLIIPDDVLVLNGENSHDEYGIKSYNWARGPTSPASGVSMHENTLLVFGRQSFL